MSRCEDVGSMVTVEKVEEEQHANFSDFANVRKTRRQILAAQFECYLKIIHDPPRTEEGAKIVPIVQLFLC